MLIKDRILSENGSVLFVEEDDILKHLNVLFPVTNF